MHDIITRDHGLPNEGWHKRHYDVDVADSEARDKWVKHPNVLLDHDVDQYYDRNLPFISHGSAAT